MYWEPTFHSQIGQYPHKNCKLQLFTCYIGNDHGSGDGDTAAVEQVCWASVASVYSRTVSYRCQWTVCFICNIVFVLRKSSARFLYACRMSMRRPDRSMPCSICSIKMQLRYLVPRRRIFFVTKHIAGFVIIILAIYIADSSSKLFDHIGLQLLLKIFYWISRRIYRQPKNAHSVS